MKKFFALFICLISFVDLSAETITNLKETEPALVLLKELKHLDQLILLTEQNLQNQKSLRKLFLDYQQKQMHYLENMQDKEITLQMIKSAHVLLEGIKEAHLVQAFDAEFIAQLTFFSKFATKSGVPKI